MKKKILAAIMSLALAGSLLAGCGSGSGAKDAAGTEAASADSAEAAEETSAEQSDKSDAADKDLPSRKAAP